MAALLLFVGLLPSKIGKVGRDRDLLHDVRLIGERVCQGRQHCGQTVSVCSEIWQHWELQAYLQRFYHLNLSRDEDRLPFRLDHPDCSPAGAGEYVAQDIGLIHYRLLRRPAL
jgi:hypothetical protein